MFSLRIRWSAPPEKVDRIFSSLGAGLRDWTPALTRVRAHLAEMFADIFLSQGAAHGSPWHPLDPDTVRKKLSAGAPEATLSLSGKLEESLTSDAGGVTGAIRRITRTRKGEPLLLFGTRLPYAVALHFGAKKSRLPAREIIALTSDADQVVLEELRQHLEAKLNEASAALSQGVA